MAREYWTQLKYRPLDATGDMIMGGAPPALEGLEAMAQVLKTRLKALGDKWWESGEEEPPLLGMLSLPRTEENRARLELLLVECIADTVGVLSVENVKSEYGPGRSFSFACDARTVYGSTRTEVEL